MNAPHVKMIAEHYRHNDAEGMPAISRWLRSGATTPPVHRAEKSRIPKGCQQDRSSVQIPIFVFHSSLLQKIHQLFAERFHPMMLGLVRDVFLHLRSCRRAHRERSISFLPRKFAKRDLLMHPHGRSLLQLPHEIGETMCGLQSDKSARGQQPRLRLEQPRQVRRPFHRGIHEDAHARRRRSSGCGPWWKTRCGNAEREMSMAWRCAVAGIPPGCAVYPHLIRWCRFAQPPANRFDAFGILSLPISLSP